MIALNKGADKQYIIVCYLPTNWYVLLKTELWSLRHFLLIIHDHVGCKYCIHVTETENKRICQISGLKTGHVN